MPYQEFSFRDFIENELDLSGLPDTPENPGGAIPEKTPSGIRQISAEDEKKFLYEVEVGLARFTTSIDTDLTNASVQMRFPSKMQNFEAGEMLQAVTGMLDSGFPKQRYTPHVLLNSDIKAERFDLSNAWDYRNYEKALEASPTSVTYFLPRSTAPTLRSIPNFPKLPVFIYGFSKRETDEISEFVSMTHDKGKYMQPEFAQVLLSRHREYIGKDIEADAIELKSSLNELCSTHPQQKMGF